MIDLHDIPFSYLVSWAKRNKNSGLTYLRTLNASPYAESCKWGDVLSTLPSTKPLKKLLAGLERSSKNIILDYEDDSAVISLPANSSKYHSFYERVKAFISEYAQELDRPSLNINESKAKDNKKRAFIIREKFVYTHSRSTSMDRGVLAHALNISRQRVDQLYDELAEECFRCLSGEKVGRVIANPVLISEFDALKQKAGTMISKESFQRYAGIDSRDEKTLEFLATTLGMRVMNKRQQPIPVIATNGLLVDYSRQIGDIISFFRKEVFGIRIAIELSAELNKIEDAALREAYLSFITNSDEFIKYKDGIDDAVALRWDYLLTVPARLCWILYEEKAIDYQTAIHSSELVKLYNNYARSYGISKISTNNLPPIAQIRSVGCWKLMSLGKTGYWKIRQNEREDYDLDKIIRHYLRTNDSTASFDGFLGYMETSGQRRFYPSDRSLRARYTNNGGKNERKVADRKNIKRLSKQELSRRYDFILCYLNSIGVTCTIADLYLEVEKNYPGTNPTTLGMWVRNLYESKKINAILGTGRRPTYISAPTVPVQLPRTEKDDLVNMALNIVWESPDHEIPSRELNPKLVASLPSTVSSQMINRALKKDGRFEFKGPRGHSTIGLSKIALAEMNRKSFVVTQTTDTEANSALSLDIEKLKACLLEEFSEDLSKSGINAQKAIDNLLHIYGMGTPITDKFSFFDILTYLPLHYERTLDNDRERMLMKGCPALVELFLKEFYELKHHADIITEIQDNWQLKNIGFRSIVSYLEQLYNYIPYKNDYSTQEERNIKYMVNSVITARNLQYAHPGQETDPSKYNQEKTIHDSFMVMLYVASKF